jgi:hypothetical protein
MLAHVSQRRTRSHSANGKPAPRDQARTAWMRVDA